MKRDIRIARSQVITKLGFFRIKYNQEERSVLMVLKYTRYVLEKQKKNYYIYYIMYVRRQKRKKGDVKIRK